MVSVPGLLGGLRVVEVGAREAVAACGGLLAQFGSDVLLVEPAGPLGHKWADRAATVAGKRVVPGDPAAHLAGADVVLLSTELSEVDRRVWNGDRPAEQILCDITAFGHSGPLAGRSASEAQVEALAGIAETTGRRDGAPVLLGAPLLEMESAVYAAAAILAALRVRREHGFGQRIDIALYDVGVNALAAFLPLPFTGRLATRGGNRHPTLSPWNSYRARDGWVLICAPTNDQWARLCGAMGRPELVSDPRFATTTSRMDNADAIDAVVGEWVGGHPVEACVEVLAGLVIPCGPVVPVDALAAEPNLAHRAMVRTAGRVRLPGCPVRWHAPTAAPHPAPAPVSGRRVTGDPASTVRPLAGVRVVEIGMNTVGPLAGKQLGALGADVVKVEPPRGDSNRHNAPLREDGEAYIFALLNTDKRGLVLDLRDERDRGVLTGVLRSADVLIENLKPGSLTRLGFGPQRLRAELPSLIYCSINGFGHDSVYPQRPALDTVVQAMSGLMSATPVDGVPTKAGISASDQLGGLFGLLAVLAGLLYRDATGARVTFDLAMQDGSAWATHRIWNGRAPNPAVMSTSDGHRLADGTPVRTVAEVLADPQTAARSLIVDRPTSDGDTWPVLGSPLRLLSTPAVVASAMPRLGVLDPGLAAEFGLLAATESGRA